VALNPLVLVHVVGGAHNDGLMMLAVMAGVAALIAGAELRAGAALVGGAAVKISAAFAGPFALLGARRPARLLAGVLIALAALAALALAVFGSGAVDSLGLVGENQAATSRYSVPATLSRLIGADVDAVRAVAISLYGLAVVGLLVWTARGGDWVRAMGWAALGLLLATGWLLPWYVIWALPLAAIATDGILTTAVLALCAFQLINRIPL
jgi:ABC-type amino acid transport substrate-binding protein